MLIRTWAWLARRWSLLYTLTTLAVRLLAHLAICSHKCLRKSSLNTMNLKKASIHVSEVVNKAIFISHPRGRTFSKQTTLRCLIDKPRTRRWTWSTKKVARLYSSGSRRLSNDLQTTQKSDLHRYMLQDKTTLAPQTFNSCNTSV